MTRIERAAKAAYEAMCNQYLPGRVESDFDLPPWESQDEDVKRDWTATIEAAIEAFNKEEINSVK